MDFPTEGGTVIELNYSSTLASREPTSIRTLAEIAVEVLKIEGEPVGKWMREQGTPPETHTLFVPEAGRPASDPEFGWPRYVRFSPHITKPVVVNNDRINYL